MHVYMTNHLDMLPDDIYQVIYRHVNQIAIQQAASIGARRNRFGTKIPNRRTMDSVIYHWLRDKIPSITHMFYHTAVTLPF